MPALVTGNEIVLSGTVGDLYWGESFTSSDVIVALAQVGRGQDVVVRINSGGGIATEGSAIHAALAAHTGKKTIIIEGIAASAASVIAMAGDEIVMAMGALMMIHDPSGFTFGTVTDHELQVKALTALATAMAGIYAERSGKTADEARADMRAELWMSPEEAVAAGYADRVQTRAASAAEGGETEIIDADREPTAFDFRLYQHPPERLVALADRRAWTNRVPATAAAPPPPLPRHQEKSMPNDQAGNGPAPTATTGNVVDLNAARAEGRSSALAYVREVRDLCALAGKPAMADAFIDKEAAPADVRKELLDARASADAARDVSTATLPGAGAAPVAGARPDDSKTMLSSMERELARAGHSKKGA